MSYSTGSHAHLQPDAMVYIHTCKIISRTILQPILSARQQSVSNCRWYSKSKTDHEPTLSRLAARLSISMISMYIEV